MMRKPLIRVLMRAHDNGQEFPVYVTTDAEAQDAARVLKADIVSSAPSDDLGLAIEQFETLVTRGLGRKAFE